MSQLLTTATVQPTDRIDFWRDMICSVYVELQAEPLPDDRPFSGSIAWSTWGDTRISRVESGAQVVDRHRDATSTDCLVSIQLAGVGQVTQAGRSAVLRPGDFALYDTTAPYRLRFDSDFTQLVLQFPREELVARNVHIESVVARRQSGSSGVGAVLTSLIRALTNHESEIGDDERDRLGYQAIDLAATAVGSVVTDDAINELNRRRILDYVELNISDPLLSVACIAESFGISTRTVQRLFAGEPTQLAAHIRNVRIVRAKQLLTDPRRKDLSIARIAAEVGFGGPSQLARVFRTSCGCSPRDYRQASRRC